MSTRTGRVTLKDLAALTGVSETAVRHIVNDRQGNVRVSEATRRRVLATAQELGYVARLQARAMATQRSYAVGVVCSLAPGVLDPYAASYFANALRAVEEVCKANGYNCIFVASELNEPSTFTEPRLMKDGSVDGALLIGLASQAVGRKLLSMGLPCVQVGNNVDPSVGIDSVYSDIDGALEQVCRRLFDWGHRRIEFALPPGPGPDKHRAAFRALAGRIPGLEPRPVTVADLVPTPADGRAMARAALARPAAEATTAFVCTMPQATGLVREMAAAGRSFPRDYSLVVLASEELGPAQLGPDDREATLISLPTHEVARQAALRLFDRINPDATAEADPVRPETSSVPCVIRAGESWGPCPST